MLQHSRTRVNDFAIKLANVNGTGSASANGLLMQAIFRMGIPVSGKNVFPSNIQGLPTWYEIRVNKDGYGARLPECDLMVAMNAQTYARDIQEVRSAGYVLYDSSWPLDPSLFRDDVNFLPIPLAAMCNARFQDPRERTLMKNISYLGALVSFLGIDMQIIEDLLTEKFGHKPALRDSNRVALQIGYEYAGEHFICPLPLRLEKMNANSDKILIDGNTCLLGEGEVEGQRATTRPDAIDGQHPLLRVVEGNATEIDRQVVLETADDDLKQTAEVLPLADGLRDSV